MKKKYIACDHFLLGQMCDTREEAERAAKGMDYEVDRHTGYSTAFNCEPIHDAIVIEVEDRCVSVEEYLRSLEEKKIAKKKFDEEVKKLHEKIFGRLEAIEIAYINTNTPYNHGDRILLTTKRANGRKRNVEAQVCGVFVDGDGKIRPDLRGESYPLDEEIISIEVLERYDYKKVKRKTVCNNCQHYHPINLRGRGYGYGFCSIKGKDVYCYKEDEPCYVNEPDKYKDQQ